MPKLFLIRHAIAEDRLVFQETKLNDDLRPLTQKGREKMERIAKKLYKLHPEIDVLAQSPLVRSQQTVDVLKKFYKKTSVKTLANLAPGSSFKDLLEDLKKFKSANVALVGHEDDLSQFLFFLLTGLRSPSPFHFKKGGIACLEYKKMEPTQFKLQWLVSPKAW
ncbi:phosphohistidine phosphatase SixA [bacterium]|nr:phosphohistidine phosphatase SixA [bacterium]